MKPFDLARQECANFLSNGDCLNGRKRCLMGGVIISRCQYFEECVAPMFRTTSDKKRAGEIRDAVAAYSKAIIEQGRRK